MDSLRIQWAILAFLAGLFLGGSHDQLCAQEALDIFGPETEETSEQNSESEKERTDKKLPKARDVINKYVQALGGYELLESRKTVHYKASATKASDPFDYEVYIAENCYRSTYHYKNGREFARTINNGVAWTTTNGVHRLITGEELDELLGRHKTMSPVTKWLDDHQKIEVVNRTKVNEKNALRLFFVNNQGHEKYRYFDEESGLLLRSIAVETYDQERRRVIRDYLDYEMIGEALVPRTKRLASTTIGTSRVRNYTFKIEDYEVDIKIPKGAFDIPKTIQRQLTQAR